MIHLNELVGFIQDSVLSASDLLKQKNLELLETFFEKIPENEKTGKTSKKEPETEDDIYKPKTVKVLFPRMTKDGPVAHEVHVPLITLIPMNMLELSELKFTAELEATLKDDKLFVSFHPTKKENSSEDEQIEKPRSTTSLEIILKPTTTPQGLRKLIEGYEKTLRAQIPE